MQGLCCDQCKACIEKRFGCPVGSRYETQYACKVIGLSSLGDFVFYAVQRVFTIPHGVKKGPPESANVPKEKIRVRIRENRYGAPASCYSGQQDLWHVESRWVSICENQAPFQTVLTGIANQPEPFSIKAEECTHKPTKNAVCRELDRQLCGQWNQKYAVTSKWRTIRSFWHHQSI